MTGLLVDGRWVAPLEIADGFWSRARGLLGKSSFDGALLIRAGRPVRSVHTIGMRFPIEVAFCDHELRVLHVMAMPPNRPPTRSPAAGVTQVVEAQAGSFAGWGVDASGRAVGSQLGISESGESGESADAPTSQS